MEKHIERTDLFFLLALTGIGAFFRFFFLGTSSLWIDEGFTLMQARAIATHGFPLLESGFVEKKDIFLPLLLSPFSALINPYNPVLPRSIVAIFGALSIPLAFFIGKSLGGRPLAWTFSFLLTFSSWHIAWSRQIRGYEVASFFLLIAILFLIRFARTARPSFFVGSFFATIFATLSKSFALLFLPTIFLCLATSRFSFKKRSFLFFLGTLGGLFVFLFFLFFRSAASFDHPFYFTPVIFGSLFGTLGILFPLAIIGFALSLREKTIRNVNISLIVFVAITILFVSFLLPHYEHRYVFLVTPIFLLYAARMIGELGKNIPLPKGIGIGIILALTTVIDAASTQSLLFFPQKEFVLESGTPQPPFHEAYERIRGEIQPEDTVVSPYPFLDILFLHRSTFALPISYTGRAEDSTVIHGREYYSGTKNLFAGGKESGAKKLMKLSRNGNVFIILDTLALRRMSPERISLLTKDASIIFESSFLGNSEQKVLVYKIPRQKSLN